MKNKSTKIKLPAMTPLYKLIPHIPCYINEAGTEKGSGSDTALKQMVSQSANHKCFELDIKCVPAEPFLQAGIRD